MEEYAIHGGKKGIDRLEILSRTVGNTTANFLDLHRESFYGNCLDLGCGAGKVTLNLADRLLGKGKVLGLDLDPIAVSKARDAGRQRRLTNLSFDCGNAHDLDIRAGYQLIYTRFLLSHLKDPEEIVAKMFNALNPGGKLLVEDTDFSGHFCYPDSQAFAAYVRLYQQLLQARGADANIGRRLHRLLNAAGFRDITVQIAQPVHTNGEGKLMAEITMAGISEALVQEGMITEVKARRLIRAIRQFREKEGTVMSLPRIVQVSAIKPSTYPLYQ